MVETKKIKEDQNPRKLYSRFLFKALILTVFCSIVPLFLSQTPELSNQTRLLELLHLILVGIAVSYGLFSRRNSNNDHKTDHNSYVPNILQVPSSVFNVHHHESDSEPSDDYNKIHTWKNKHQIKIPEIVISKDKPLLLPVRSLNHTLLTSDTDRWEKVRSKRQLLKNLVDDDDDDDKSDVLPSPIPWRSRSSSFSNEIDTQPSIRNNPTIVESQPSIQNNITLVESQPSIKTPSSARHNLHSKFHPPPSPPPLPPLPKFYNSTPRKAKKSTKTEAKSVENIVGKHPPPSPPPPPPPLPAFYKSKSRELAHKSGEFRPPPPPPPPPVDYYKSHATKLRVSRKLSENKAKVDDRSSRRSNVKKVWWSDPIVEPKEQENEEKSYLGSKDDEKEEQISRDSEDDEMKERKIEEGVCESSNVSDVDKKADEFIAKFREQIRLQRIESIKRSTNKITANASR